jgi:hypothetical protein
MHAHPVRVASVRYVGYFDKVLTKEIDAFPAKKLKCALLLLRLYLCAFFFD